MEKESSFVHQIHSPLPMFIADVAVSLPRLSQVFSRQELDYTDFIS